MKYYGFDISNYCNMVKMALVEKGCDFEFVETYPSDDPVFLQQSPMGKLPLLETDAGFICETSVILEYLEDTQGGVALLPSDSFERARVRELAKLQELYMELPARRCYGHLYFGGDPVGDDVKDNVRTELQRGLNALKTRAKFAPYLAGDVFTHADIFFMYTIDLAADVAVKLLDWDLLEELPGSRELLDRLNGRESAKKIAADRELGWEAYKKHFAG